MGQNSTAPRGVPAPPPGSASKGGGPATADDLERLLELEWRYCRNEPHWRLGRYLLYTLEHAHAPREPHR